MNLFDILGPVMVGPSSSHTAGAVRIGRMARALLGQEPVKAQLLLHGSFASTGEGHGTHQALIAGLLGLTPDDSRVPDSFALAQERGLEFHFGTCDLRDVHPNSVLVTSTASSSPGRGTGAAIWRWGPPPPAEDASGSSGWTAWTPPSPASCPPLWSTTRTSPAVSARSPGRWLPRG